MINTPKNQCSGCGACIDICPKNCINMKEDKEGFKYPVVDISKCINCSLCESVCSSNHKMTPIKTINSYAVFSKLDNVRYNSSSGGMFYHLAKFVLDQKGVVFGAAFDTDWNLKHIKIDNLEQLSKLMKSKYIQSSTEGIFSLIKELLEANKMVLFSGTPCQVNALSLFLKKDYENLVKLDLICHGVPSNKVFQSYLNSFNKVNSIDFRSKLNGWKRFSMVIDFDNKKRYENSFDNDNFFQLFLSNYILRPSCYNCKSKGKNRTSDFTVADFWGVDTIIPEMADDKGTSLLLINSDKGAEIFNKISNEIYYKKVDKSEALKYNKNYYHSENEPKYRNILFKYIRFSKNPKFKIIFNTYHTICLFNNLSLRIKNILKK